MSIKHYQAPEALALLERIGWPEWLAIYATAGNEHLAFRDEGPKPFFESIDQQGEQRELPDHVALCLLRNHLREWLKKAEIFVEWYGASSDYRIGKYHRRGYDYGMVVLLEDGRWEDEGGDTEGFDAMSFQDEDLALLAAAQAKLDEDEKGATK